MAHSGTLTIGGRSCDVICWLCRTACYVNSARNLPTCIGVLRFALLFTTGTQCVRNGTYECVPAAVALTHTRQGIPLYFGSFMPGRCRRAIDGSLTWPAWYGHLGGWHLEHKGCARRQGCGDLDSHYITHKNRIMIYILQPYTDGETGANVYRNAAKCERGVSPFGTCVY